MPSSETPNVIGHIEQLLADRQRHVESLAAIEQTLAGIAAALEGVPSNTNGHAPSSAEPAVAVPEKKRRGRPPGTGSAAIAPVASRKRRGVRGSYAVTGDDLIVAFIKQNKNATTGEIKAHWASENRRGTADNVLSKLFRENRVNRTPIGAGIRGSRYSLR